MLLDEFLPDFDARERHATVIHGSATRVYAALWAADLAPPLVRLMMGLRALPGASVTALKRPRDAWRQLRARARGSVTMRDVVAQGFSLLAEDPPRELVLGVDGAFWRLRGDLRPLEATSFGRPQPAGTARAAWNFYVRQTTDGACELSTETRVKCADAESRWRFLLYWLVVRAGSGLIRRLMLRSIKRAAEG